MTEEDRKKIENIATNYDSVKYTDTVIKENVKSKDRKSKVMDKLDDFAKSKLVITDRLHGMVFAKLTHTPCIVIGNYSHKVKGVYEWIKESKFILYVENIDKIDENINFILKKDLKEKENKIKFNYDKLINILKEG